MANESIKKFTCIACRWHDFYGNTYHSVRITRHKDGAVISSGKNLEYGYDSAYEQTALKLMAEAKWLPVKYRGENDRWAFERENNYPTIWNVSDGLKRDAVANGTLA